MHCQVFVCFFFSGQIIFCLLMTNYNFTGVILHTWYSFYFGGKWPWPFGKNKAGTIPLQSYRSSASVLSRNCRKLKGDKKKTGWKLEEIFFTKGKKNDMTDYYQRSAGKIFSSIRSTVDKTFKIVCTNFL